MKISVDFILGKCGTLVIWAVRATFPAQGLGPKGPPSNLRDYFFSFFFCP